jgi:hypothetical protein
VLVEAHARALELVCKRGYLVSLRLPGHGAFAHVMATSGLRDGVRQEIEAMIGTLDSGLYQPETIEADGDYEIFSVTTPIFDEFGRVAFTLGVNLPTGATSGRRIKEIAGRLSELCAAAAEHGRSGVREPRAR